MYKISETGFGLILILFSKLTSFVEVIPILFLDDGKGFRIVQNRSRQGRMS